MTNPSEIEPPKSKIEENKAFLIEQSKMLQEIIKRMANNSLELKKSGLVAWTALVGFGLTSRINALFALALVFAAIVAVLDVLYLQQEQKFRNHFNILTKVICGYPLSPFERKTLMLVEEIDAITLMNKVEGNFIKLVAKSAQPLSKSKQRAANWQGFWSATKSWANWIYLIIFIISIVLFFTPLPPLQTPTSPQTSTPTVLPSVTETPSPVQLPNSPTTVPSLPTKRSPNSAP